MIHVGTVAVTFKIMPADAGTDLDKIKNGVRKSIANYKEMQLKSMEEMPIAFGLKAVEILLILPDTSMSGLEDELAKIKGVASVEAGNVTLI